MHLTTQDPRITKLASCDSTQNPKSNYGLQQCKPENSSFEEIQERQDWSPTLTERHPYRIYS